MKKYIILLALIIGYQANAQVGIETDKPTEALDINGIVRVRNLPTDGATNAIRTNPDGTASSANNQTFTATKMVVADNNGVLGVINRKHSTHRLMEIYSSLAQNKVTVDISNSGNYGAWNGNNIDLGISQVVTVPAGSKYHIIIDYDIPIGTDLVGATTLYGFYGISFTKNNIEVPMGSRKYTIPQPSGINDPNNGGISGSRMVSISGKYIDVIDNTASTSNKVATYKLNGYIEIYRNDKVKNIHFNMWSATGNNYNWGKSAMTTTVYEEN